MRTAATIVFGAVCALGLGSTLAQVSPYGQEIYQQGARVERVRPITPTPYGQQTLETPQRPAWADSGRQQSFDVDTRRETRHPTNDFDRKWGYGR